ncbi:hypothetical protein LAY57_23355 [Argonema antarcticum A004/B2]|nr:hypothetical protein [Argonema antarcticum A004/B2]
MDFVSLFATIFLTAILTWVVERTGDALLKMIVEKGKSDSHKKRSLPFTHFYPFRTRRRRKQLASRQRRQLASRDRGNQ